MMRFRYSALSSSGERISGYLDATNRKVAMSELKTQGLRPIELTEAKKRKKESTQTKLLSKADIVIFTEELSELLNAGLPLEPALASMQVREEEGVLKQTATQLREYVTDGSPFHSALSKVSDRFDPLYCNLVAAGEASGSLASIIGLHANYLKEQAELRSRLILAMIYPCALVLTCFGVLMLFIFFLLPMIAELLASTPGQKIPIGIKLAMMLGDFLRAQWGWLIVFCVVMLIGLKVWFSSERNKEKWDRWKMHIPLFGKVIRFGFYVQWLQTLGNLLSNGVPLVEALNLTNQTVTNRSYKKGLIRMTAKVEDGYKLTRSMRVSELFPSSMTDLVAVGEKTGDMAKAIGRTANYYNSQLSSLMGRLMGAVTIGILIGMAILVGVLCYTMLQAIYGSMGGMRR